MKKIIFTSTTCVLLFCAVPSVFAQTNVPVDTQLPYGLGKDQVQIRGPEPRVNLPGLHFTSENQLSKPTGEVGSRILHIPYLAEYIAAVYKYAVAIASILAVVMIIVAGFQWTASGGSPDAITSAKKRIANAVTGLIIALGSYTLLYTINPELVQFRSLDVAYVEPNPDLTPEEDEPDSIETTQSVTDNPGEFAEPVGINIKNYKKGKVPKIFKEDIEAVAKTLARQQFGLRITSAFRSEEEQVKQILDKCQNPPRSDTCNHKPGKPNACILKGGNLSTCPHTTGRALDIWATKKDANGVWQ